MKFLQYVHAMESEGEATPVDEVAEELIDIKADREESDEIIANVEEANQIHDTLDQMNESVERAAEDEGFTPAEAEAIRPAVEHFRNRLGYREKNVFPSLEAFGGKTSKKEGARQLAELNRKTLQNIDRATVVAQEGFINNVRYRFGLVFSNRNRIGIRLEKASQDYDNRGPKDGKLEKPPFAKLFNFDGKPHVRSSDVLQVSSNYLNTVNKGDLIKLVESANSQLEELVIAVNKPTLEIEEERLKEIDKISRSVNDLRKKIEAIIEPGKADMSRKVDYDPISPPDKKKLEELVYTTIRDNRLEKAIDKFGETAYEASELQRHKLSKWLYAMGGLGSIVAGAYLDSKQQNKKDVRAAKQGIDAGIKIYNNIYWLVTISNEICYASVSYIAASTKK